MSIQDNHRNGGLVHEVWGLLGDTTHIASFNYFPDAKKFAEMKASLLSDNPHENRSYIATCTDTGKQQIYRKAEDSKAEGR